MASNFKISLNRNNNSLQINLRGDFDGSSAFELINTLKKHQGDSATIFINTDGLSHLDPFGVEVFQKKYAVHKLCLDLMFTGKQAAEIAPN